MKTISQSRVECRLVAILAADVAGYSRLMGVDEEGTLERLKAPRGELLYPKIGEHHSRIIKTTGDGLLLEFASVVDAVRALPDKPSIAVLPFQNPERRSGARIFRRRHGRGSHYRTQPDPLAVRDRQQFELRLRRQVGGSAPGRTRNRSSPCARRLGTQGRQPGPHYR